MLSIPQFILLLFLTGFSINQYQGKATENKVAIEYGLYLMGYNHNPFRKLSHNYNKNYTIHLGKTKKYGFNKKIRDLKNGQYVIASIQIREVKNTGQFICTKSQNGLKYSIRKYAEGERGQWQTLIIEQYINEDSTNLHFYAFASKGLVEFKNLQIVIYDSVPKPIESESPILRLIIPENEKTIIDEYAKTAIRNGVIDKKQKKYEQAYILNNSDSISVQIRLKGDWTDHLSSGKESYRVKTKGEMVFEGMRAFSIQHPKTRNFMHEWFMHYLCKRESLLATRYDFIRVEINGVYKGVYALEEHFEKQLIESSNKRESPILKLDESGGWAFTVFKKQNSKSLKLPVFESTIVSVFRKRKTIKNVHLKRLFIEGAKLVTLYKNLYTNIGNIVDVKSTGKYFALLELGNVEHGHQWHNNRFYFNPINQKLEFIGFDMNPGHNPFKQLFVQQAIGLKPGPKEWQLIQPLIQNRDFKKHYLYYLRKFTDENYLKRVSRELVDVIKEKEQLISYEIPQYKFNYNFYRQRSLFIRSQIDELDSLWELELDSNKSIDDYTIPHIFEQDTTLPYLKDVSINAYVNQIDSNVYKLEFCNYLQSPVKVVGYEDFNNNTIILEKPIHLNYFKNTEICQSVSLHSQPKKVLFEVIGNDPSVRTKKVLQWPKPKGYTARVELSHQFSKKSSYYSIEDSVLTFNKGHLIISDLIYIPENYHVIISEGTTIDFRKEGGIICTQSVIIQGAEANNVRFISNDTTNNGLTILNASKVLISHVEFDNMKPLNYRNWSLSGGINIFESVVSINNVTIKNANSEDAINLISSSVNVNYLNILEASADGLDSDFCSGQISNCQFSNIGNDGLDFSGSKIVISNTSIKNADDKGVSCGEKSNIIIQNAKIENCKIGIAVKDASLVTVSASSLINVYLGFAVFKKKPEYNQPKLSIKSLLQFSSKLPIYLDHDCFTFYNNIMISNLLIN
jgi:hypothetical protein